MVLEFFRGKADQELEAVEQTIREMLLNCRHTFDLAINALLGGADPSIVGPDIRATDRKVNKAERAVRSDLVVHASVRGSNADMPFMLISMSIVKDAERIGDYAKNIWDLADAGVNLSEVAEGLDELLRHRDRTSQLIATTATVFADRDAGEAHSILEEGDVWQDEYDDIIIAQLSSEGSTEHAVARALLYRYLKRITAHALNVLTSLVMPIHRLDYYDEAKADREA
ncbi:MAG: hypothetical protein HKN07_03735 [Acidimicrobiia bacterium]|nr:hypothetical protein [Acidimicrobiia bacterium]NNF63347.1 hypothetical protein [Acidimicrobiia bacterium]